MRSSLLLAVAAALLILVGCSGGNATPEPDLPSPTIGSAPSEVVESPSPPASDEPSPSPILVTPSPLPAELIEPPPSAGESPGNGAGSDCTGTDQNRTFFEDAADILGWPVYCAVLPTGWFVGAGNFTRADGGRLEITYRGPGGVEFELHEGAFCAATDGCVPPGSDAGSVAFGDLAGTLVALDDGGQAIVVDRGAELSWLAIGRGLEKATFLGFGAELVKVGD